MKQKRQEPIVVTLRPNPRHPFTDDLRAVMQRLRVAERAQEDGRKGLPKSRDTAPNAAQQDIADWGRNCINEIRQYTTKKLRDSQEALERIDIDPIESDLAPVVEAARHKLIRQQIEAREGLVASAQEEIARRRECRFFQARNRLERSAEYQESPLLPAGTLAVMVLLEAAANAYLYKEASDLGLIGGWTLAILIGVVNCGAAYAIGLGILRNLWHVKTWRKVLGGIGLIPSIVWVGGFVLATAHLRVLLEQTPDDAWREFLPHMIAGPFDISNFDALMLVGLGTIMAAFAMLHGVRDFDPYVGYRAVDLRWRDAERTWRRRCAGVREVMAETVADAEKMLDARVEQAEQKAREVARRVTDANQDLQVYTQSAERVERLVHAALAAYRAENDKVRVAPPPPYWPEFPALDRGIEDHALALSVQRDAIIREARALRAEATRRKDELAMALQESLSQLHNLQKDVEREAADRHREQMSEAKEVRREAEGARTDTESPKARRDGEAPGHPKSPGVGGRRELEYADAELPPDDPFDPRV